LLGIFALIVVFLFWGFFGEEGRNRGPLDPIESRDRSLGSCGRTNHGEFLMVRVPENNTISVPQLAPAAITVKFFMESEEIY
jgi:hypothetical protein